MEPIRVLLVDDRSCLRTGVRSLLEDVEGFEIVGETECADDVVGLAAHCAPDVVLLDLDPNAAMGFAVLDALAEHGFHGRVVVWSLRGGAALRKAVEQRGGGAFLEKGVAPNDLLDILQQMARRFGSAGLDDPPPRPAVWRFVLGDATLAA